MGTSKSYSAKLKGQPQWGQLSSIVTRTCGTGGSNQNLGKIISRYVEVMGGASNAGRGNSKIGGRAGIRTANRLGGFLGAFSSSGGNLQQTLKQIGLTDLIGKSLNEVINHLLEYCSGPSSSIDDVAAKEASKMILEELVSNAETVEEFQENLQNALDKGSLADIFIRYFGYYIFTHLSIMFHEKLIVEKGKTQCDDLFRQIKDFISEKLRNINKTNPLNNIDWNSNEADKLIKNIQEDVLRVFEGYES